jgi:hypothetical protein
MQSWYKTLQNSRADFKPVMSVKSYKTALTFRGYASFAPFRGSYFNIEGLA